MEAENVYLSPAGYQPIKGPGTPDVTAAGITSSQAGTLYGFSKYDNSSAVFGYLYGLAGEVQHLNLLGANNATNTFSLDTDFSYVDYARFGDDIFFVGRSLSFGDTPPNLVKFNTGGGGFSVVSGSILMGTSIGRTNNFIMMGGVTDTGYSPYSFRWSGFNQPDEWAVSELTQANIAEVDTPELGTITAIVGGPSPMIFQERGITRIRYVGPPKIWAQRLISASQGVNYAQAVVEVGRRVYFINQNGVFMTDGNSVQEISTGQVSNWVRGVIQSRLIFTYGSYRADTKLIIWGIAADAGPSYSVSLVYNLETGAFSTISGDYYGTARGENWQFDSLPVSVVPQAGDVSNSKLTVLDGTTLEATMTTGHLASKGKRTFVDGVEPIYEGSGATVALSAKERIRDAASFSAYASEEAATGIAEITADGRSVATSVKFAAGASWSDLSECVVNIDGAGER